MTDETPEKIESTQGERNAEPVTDADEARIVAAWKTGKYRSKQRCLEVLGLEMLHNAALWKRVRRAIDRDARRAANASAD